MDRSKLLYLIDTLYILPTVIRISRGPQYVDEKGEKVFLINLIWRANTYHLHDNNFSNFGTFWNKNYKRMTEVPVCFRWNVPLCTQIVITIMIASDNSSLHPRNLYIVFASDKAIILNLILFRETAEKPLLRANCQRIKKKNSLLHSSFCTRSVSTWSKNKMKM